MLNVFQKFISRELSPIIIIIIKKFQDDVILTIGKYHCLSSFATKFLNTNKK